jgi:hypothetical protein
LHNLAPLLPSLAMRMALTATSDRVSRADGAQVDALLESVLFPIKPYIVLDKYMGFYSFYYT